MKNVFKMLAENSILPMWIKDLDYKFIFVNKSYADLQHRIPEEIIGLKNEDLYDKDLSNKFNEYCDEVVEKKAVNIKEVYTEAGYRQCVIIPLLDNNGELVALAGIISVTSDISRIKEKEYEIELQKVLTNKIIDILPGVIFYKDLNSKYVYANKACRDFYSQRGIPDIIGKSELDICQNKEQGKKFMEDDKHIIENKTPIHNEIVYKDKDGEFTYREVIKIPLLDKYGNVKGVVGRSLDITERKKYQDKLEYLSYTDILTGAKNRTYFEEVEKRYSEEGKLPLGVIMGDANGLKLVNDTFGHRQGDKLLIDITEVLKNVSKNVGEVFRIGGDEFVILVPEASLKQCEELILEIEEKCNQYKNDLFNISISLGAAVKYDAKKDIYEVIKEAEDKVYRNKLLQKSSIKGSILTSLKIGLGVNSGETEQHNERVVIRAIKVGEKLGLSMSELDELKIASGLHDIGKIGISDDILSKSTSLTDEEYEIIKTHTEKGYRIIKASSELKSVAKSVLYHHERWDGNGYPMGLKGEEIPLLARIISVCDTFDVMISGRVYKSAMSKKSALEELKRCAGTQFDPKVVDIFIDLYK
ncbi:diguanylate cyclase [Clostridium sp. NSJ-6]|uniref:Diguanylate cyclase n=1 Tax=Clostridium hominis TaxID=2763036 RepID=A0ABR7D8R9_9CLOT|nr:HD domain-containing phosphohydrolase [Clostridium hominis]MBC5627774.1 diguanylate cyclase [Clostridium hominis]